MKTRSRMRVALLPLLSLFAAAAAAASIEYEGHQRLVVAGTLDGSGLAFFSQQLVAGRARTVVFEDSRGGSAEVAEAYARAIHAAGASTEVRGQCAAACAYAFLAGRERRFTRGLQVNSLLIPLGARPREGDLALLAPRAEAPPKDSADPGDDVAPAAVAAVAAAAPQLVPAAIREAWRPERGVLFTTQPTLFGRVYNAYYCDGLQGRDTSKCEGLSGVDPLRLGVLTGP